MAALVFREHLRRVGLVGEIRVSSAGIESWHVGEPADPRTVEVLTTNGYPADHTAAAVGTDHLLADLLVAMDSGHESSLLKLTGDAERVRLLMTFIPEAVGDLSVPDPYFGDESGFSDVLHTIEAAMPGLMEWALERSATEHAEIAGR
jgi:protein-tyrosine phosphatase